MTTQLQLAEEKYQVYLDALRAANPEVAETASKFRPWIRYKNKGAKQEYVRVVRPFKFRWNPLTKKVMCDCMTDMQKRDVWSPIPEGYVIFNVDPDDLVDFDSTIREN